MLRLLHETDDDTLTARFVQSAVPQHFGADLNELLVQALERVGSRCLRSFLAMLAENKVRQHPGGVFNLLVRLCYLPGPQGRPPWRDALRTAGTPAFRHFPSAVPKPPPKPWHYSSANDTQALDVRTIRDLCLAVARLQLEAEDLEPTTLL